MKTLIVYASKTGSTEKCARMLADRIPGAELADLCAQTPDPAPYDQVIVGGSVRMGSLHAAARKFLREAQPVLLQKRFGVFVCAGFADKADAVLQKDVDAQLRARALVCECLGGEIDLAKQRGFERLIVKMVGRVFQGENAAPPPRLLPERIAAFAAKFAEA